MVPTFDAREVKVLFVLGGPGAGKGTQCERLVRMFDYVHLSAGDLLREERAREDSQVGEIIRKHIREGTIVPSEITISLLKTAMTAATPKRKFLIDGFPRNIEQGVAFEEQVCQGRAVLFFDCEEDVMVERLLGRSLTSGRDDDNIESIRKRLVTYRETTMPVINFYAAQGKVFKFDSNCSKDRVTEKVVEVLKNLEAQ
jgi:UMP-CMP kinase